MCIIYFASNAAPTFKHTLCVFAVWVYLCVLLLGVFVV